MTEMLISFFWDKIFWTKLSNFVQTPSFINYKKGCNRLAAASNKVYQLLVHGRWFSTGTPASSTTKTGRMILLKVALNTKNQSIMKVFWQCIGERDPLFHLCISKKTFYNLFMFNTFLSIHIEKKKDFYRKQDNMFNITL